jgi:DNA invertase Pin-like site-specific DNA recombinase
MLIGYARVSTDEQDTAAQVTALKAAGCERMYREKASGGRWDRPELHRLLDHLRQGDVLVVWKLIWKLMMMQMVGAFAEFERAMLKERTKAGLDAARQDGRIGGRRPKLSPQQQAEIKKMVSKGGKTAADAARLFKIHPATVSRLLARDYAK